MRSSSLLFAVVLLAACQKPETPEQATMRMAAESDSAKAAIAPIAVRYATYLNNHHADSLAALFMDGGIMMPPNGKASVGRDSIKAMMTASPLPPGASITLLTVEVSANGPLAVERGTYSFNFAAQGRTPAMTTTGKYLNHWHRMNGSWQIAAQIWNDDMPMMPMPPAPRH